MQLIEFSPPVPENIDIFSGEKWGFYKAVSSINVASREGGYAFGGEWLNVGTTYELPEKSMIIRKLNGKNNISYPAPGVWQFGIISSAPYHTDNIEWYKNKFRANKTGSPKFIKVCAYYANKQKCVYMDKKNNSKIEPIKVFKGPAKVERSFNQNKDTSLGLIYEPENSFQDYGHQNNRQNHNQLKMFGVDRQAMSKEYRKSIMQKILTVKGLISDIEYLLNSKSDDNRGYKNVQKSS